MEDRDFTDGRPFTGDERKELRRIMRDEAYSRHFWKMARLWLGYSSAAVTFVFMIWNNIKGYLPWLN